MIPEGRALTPQSQTVKITDTHDDMFILETGVGIDSSLVSIKDPNMDLRAFLVFREIDVNYWEPLENATLRLHTSNTLSFDADSSVTIYGMKISELQDSLPLTAGNVLSIGFTSAHTDYNTSQFYGSQWWEIDVTDIVEELIRNPNWDGDGHAGTETGDAIGFHIVGAEGDDKRYFYDYSVGNGLESQLVIHWNHEPPPPSGFPDADYNDTYRGYHIFNYTTGESWVDYGLYNYVYVQGGEFTIVDDQTLRGVNIVARDDDDFRLVRYRDELGQTFTKGTVLFGINVTRVNDKSGGAHRAYFAALWGHSNANLSVYQIDNTLKDACLLMFESPDDADDNIILFSIHTHDSGLWNIKRTGEYNITEDQTFAFNVTWDYPTESFFIDIYNDTSFTDLIYHMNRTNYAPINTAYNWEFAFNTLSNPNQDTSEVDFNTISEEYAEKWAVVDENGTTIADDLDSYDDALIVIEDELGADPEDPDPPGQDWEETGPFTRFRTRLYILILGIALMFGPPIYFAYSRPSGYEFVIGLFIMLIGLAFMIASGSI